MDLKLDRNCTCVRLSRLMILSLKYHVMLFDIMASTVRSTILTVLQPYYIRCTIHIFITLKQEYAKACDPSIRTLPFLCPMIGLQSCFFTFLERFNSVFKASKLVVLKINHQSVVYIARHCFIFRLFWCNWRLFRAFETLFDGRRVHRCVQSVAWRPRRTFHISTMLLDDQIEWKK